MFASEQYFQKQALLSESLPVRPWNYAQGQPLGWGDLSGETDCWTDGLVGEWMDGRRDRQVGRRTHDHMDRQMCWSK